MTNILYHDMTNFIYLGLTPFFLPSNFFPITMSLKGIHRLLYFMLLNISKCSEICFAGRKRKWFKIDEAIRVLQCHKPVHAEYLRKLTPHCGPTNGNAQEPENTDDNAPLRQTASQDCELARLHRQNCHQKAPMQGKPLEKTVLHV